jgi:hypothetical protein
MFIWSYRVYLRPGVGQAVPLEILGAGSEFIFLTIGESDYIDNNHR